MALHQIDALPSSVKMINSAVILFPLMKTIIIAKEGEIEEDNFSGHLHFIYFNNLFDLLFSFHILNHFFEPVFLGFPNYFILFVSVLWFSKAQET